MAAGEPHGFQHSGLFISVVHSRGSVRAHSPRDFRGNREHALWGLEAKLQFLRTSYEYEFRGAGSLKFREVGRG